MILPLEVLRLVVFVTRLSSAVGFELYHFGPGAGDKKLPIKDDSTSQRILVPEFPFFGKNFTELYVNENGIIFFGAKPRDTSPAAVFSFPLSNTVYAAAPYWADVLTKRGGNVSYRVTKENLTVDRISRDVRRAFPHYSGFRASSVTIATWDDVAFYAAKDNYTQLKNTFQVIITSNGSMSFVGYLYHKLSWTTGTFNDGNESGLGGNPAKVGFSFGNSYYQPSVSGTNAVLTLVSTTNCGQPGLWFFRVDDIKRINDKICESEESVSFYPVGVPLLSGANVLITGLCYHPGSDVLCDFGEAGTVKGHKFSDSRAVCSVPFTATKVEAEVSVYPSEVSKLNFAKTFVIEPVNFCNTSVQLSEYPTLWIPGSRVRVLWNSKELADQPVTIDIINLVEHLGTIQVHSNITVVNEQENTGKSEFVLPDLDNISFLQQHLLQIIRVRSVLKDGYNKYAAKHWIWSDIFLLTNQTSAHKSCLNRVNVSSEKESRTQGYDSLSSCPKTRRQLLADHGRFTTCTLFYQTMDSCYLMKTQSDERSRRKCCYDKDGEFTHDLPCRVSIQTVNTQTVASAFSLYRKDVVPYLECCVFSDNCFEYQNLRIPSNNSRYIPPNIGALFGDPHIITLDGVEYTFNGYGEYTVLNANDSQFLLQGRMQPLYGWQNAKSPATGFTAFALRQKGGSRIQVHRDISNSMVLLINGERKVIDFGQKLHTTGVLIRNSSRENYLRVVLEFTCGITVYVENAAVLQLALTVPVEFKGKIKGLLGYWNDNTNEEYLLPNGEFLITASTMSQVHFNFGQSWITTADESLFTYGPEEKHADYFDFSYVPMFMEGYDPILAKMNSGLRKRALTTCERSFQCIFDIAVTRRVDIGQDTKDFQQWFLQMGRDLHDEGCNANLNLESGSVQTIVNDSIITHHFSCNPGYVMAGKGKMSCRGGVWDGSKPRCYREASIKCRSLNIAFPNGEFEEQGNKFGDRYKFKCDLPFVLIGDHEIVCGKDGHWSGQVPSCQRRNCSQLTIKNSRIVAGNDGHLHVSCNQGYNLIGPSELRCTNGLLNETLPSCVREQSRMASSRQTNFVPVVVIGVVVSVVAIFIAVVTVCLVCRHRRQNTAESPRSETPGDQKRVAV